MAAAWDGSNTPGKETDKKKNLQGKLQEEMFSGNSEKLWQITGNVQDHIHGQGCVHAQKGLQH